MLIKTLESSNGTVTLKLTQKNNSDKKDFFLFESITVDAQKNQKVKVEILKCANAVDANTKFQIIVEDYLKQGYMEKLPVKQNFLTNWLNNLCR